MDILRPSTVWINGICYRKNDADEGGGEIHDDGDRNYGKRSKIPNHCFFLHHFDTMYAYCCWGEIPGVTGDVADEYEDTDLSQADALSAIDNSGT